MNRHRAVAFAAVVWAALHLTSVAWAADWPMWRYDAGRTAASPQELAAELHPQWSRQLGAPARAWPDAPRVQFDDAPQPVVAGKTVFVASTVTDSVTAYNTETGELRWQFFTDGPVRFAPAVWQGRVYFTSDDGGLYCADAREGSLLWRFSGGPRERRILGNGRLISAWPARGGPVVADGKVYFARGIWPTMGIFVFALDAATGDVVWQNDRTGSIYMAQAYGRRAPAYSGPSPQGYLVVAGDYLLVPCGRARPACFDRRTGELVYYNLGHSGGNVHVAAVGPYFFNGGWMFGTKTGNLGYSLAGAKRAAWQQWPIVLTPQTAYFPDGTLRARSIAGAKIATRVIDKERDYGGWLKANERSINTRGLQEVQWDAYVEADAVWLMAGGRLYVSRAKMIKAVELPGGAGDPQVVWQTELNGTPGGMAAADDRLFASTREGGLYCFGPAEATPQAHPLPAEPRPAGDEWTAKARAILDATDSREGYCLALGLSPGRLAEELAIASGLHVIALDPDPARVDAARRRLAAKGLYGSRVAICPADLASAVLPPYLAELIVSEDLDAAGMGRGKPFVTELYQRLRPYGGTACVELDDRQRAMVAGLVAGGSLANAELDAAGDNALLRRVGALPGAGAWTHENADPANSMNSHDRIVRAPLGVLWFGGPGGWDVFFDRHPHPPRVQICGGRMFIEGPDVLHAIDVYTGRLLWQAPISGLGVHFKGYGFYPGARLIGGQFASAPDAVYVTTGGTILRLDAATGRETAAFDLPEDGPAYEGPILGYVAALDDLLLAGATPMLMPADFRHSEFARVPVEMLDNLMEFLHDCKDVEFAAREQGESKVQYAVRCLNDLLVQTDLAPKLPAGYAARARAAMLSGGAWLQTDKGVPDQRLFVRYSVEVPADGAYSFWVRKFYHHGPFRWRFDDLPWKVCDNSLKLEDQRYLRRNICANWKKPGRITLSKGTRDLQIELLAPPGQDVASAFDCFMLTNGNSRPSYKYKPEPAAGEALVWWEGEDAREHNFPDVPGFRPENDPDDAGREQRARELAAKIKAHLDETSLAPLNDANLQEMNRQLLVLTYPIMSQYLARRDLGAEPWRGSASKKLVAMDRQTGEVAWELKAQYGFRHSAIAAGSGKVFCLDRLPDAIAEALKRHGDSPTRGPRLFALDAATGKSLWTKDEDIGQFGLAYSEEHDILLQGPSGRTGGGNRMTAYRGSTSEVLWRRGQSPCRSLMLHGDEFYTDATQYNLLTGERLRSRVYASTKGCGSSIASEHLITFRSSTVAYVDLNTNSDTINFGGVRAGCTESLIPADGVLNAPNLSHGCSCSYPIFTSLALIHVPEQEMWSHERWPEAAPVGVNLGAPGGRKGPEGVSWVEFPAGDYELRRLAKVTPAGVNWFRRHSPLLEGEGLKWVAASGCEGLESLAITVEADAAEDRRCTVRLHFAEPGDARPGERVFSVSLQGKRVLEDLDVVREAGGPNRPLVREFAGIAIRDVLTVEFDARAGKALICGVEVRPGEN